MKLRNEILKARRITLLAGVTLLAAVPFSSAFAADQAPVVKAPVVADPGWYFHGGLEAGGRFYIGGRPGKSDGRASAPANWETPLTAESRQKLDEYGPVPPGAFLDWINLQAGSNDGRYAIDFWGRNVGLRNQGYYLDIAEIGRHYLTLGFEATPHYLGFGKSIFGGTDTNLTVPDAVQTTLQANVANAAGANAAGVTARTNIENAINAPGVLNTIDLYTQRDKFIFGYRTTPTHDLEFKVDFTTEHRTGYRPLGIGWGFGTTAAVPRPSSGAIEVPQPLDDHTHNVNAGGEYIGTTPWGTKWNANLKYVGSFYDNKISSFDVENPFCITCITTGNPHGPNILRYGGYADNSANGFVFNSGTDMPFFKSRWNSTTQYTVYRQNDPFYDTSTNGVTLVNNNIINQAGVLGTTTSLDGEVRAFLSNNALTSRLTNDLTNTVRVRYYDLDDRTPQLSLLNYNYADGGLTTTAPLTRARQSWSKLNVNDELRWKANKWLTLGGGYFFQQTKFDNSEVGKLTEHMGKVYAHAHPTDWMLGRLQYSYASRRYDDYALTASVQTQPMRIFTVANRDQHKADAQLEFAVFPNATITPNAGLKWTDYPDDVVNQSGVNKDHQWNAGIEFGVMFGPARLSASYNYEEHKLHMALCCGSGTPNTVALVAANTWQSDITQRYNTFLTALDVKAIPNKLDFRFEYVLSQGLENINTIPCASLADGCTGAGGGVTLAQTQYPDEKALFQRFNVIARYIVDPDLVRKLGWTGEVVAKARYTYERNNTANWANDTVTPYNPQPDQTADISGANRSLFMAYNNPNYSAHLMALSVALRW